MAGRKCIPIEIKKAKGTHKKERDKEIPDVSESKPQPPEWLDERAQQLFWLISGRLNELGLASKSYTEMIALCALRMEEVEHYTKTIKNDGYFYDSVVRHADKIATVKREHPALKLRDKASRHIQSLLAEFGLSPSAIQKVGTLKQKPKKNEFDGF